MILLTALIDRVDIACKYRIYEKSDVIKNEPVYDPSNPWGVK